MQTRSITKALAKLSGMTTEVKININDSIVPAQASTKSRKQIKTQPNEQNSMETTRISVKKILWNFICKIPTILGVFGGLFSIHQIYESYNTQGQEILELMVINRSRAI